MEEKEKRKLDDILTTDESETKKRKIEEETKVEDDVVYDEFGDQDVVVCHCG